MAIFPVILCGGAGSRLWPASRAEHPKPFIDLIGDRSLFQRTLARVGPLAEGGGRLIVVAGREHRGFIEDELARAGQAATLILEPQGRESAPAMAAAALWIADRTPSSVALFVASDHHIPDDAAFRAAVRDAVPAADAGRIVTFGVRPTEPSSAYGYIQPESPGLSTVRRFVEKPDRAGAEAYLAKGYLWNSGNFMVRAETLLSELDRHAPGLIDAVRAALPAESGDIVPLTRAFASAPKTSIDYAVMEKSDRVSVLPVDFAWSDLGAWDAVAATGEGGRGIWIDDGSGEGNLVRAADGMTVATAGVSGFAIIAERDAVLVCRLDRSQAVKGLADQLKARSPEGGTAQSAADLAAAVDRFSDWMRLAALPLWATLGVDEDGGFVETLDHAGRAASDFRRARVQARQAYVYSAAGREGWAGPWRSLVERGLDRFEQTNLRPDGLYRTRVSRDGEPVDETAWLYDQAFALFAFAAAADAGSRPQLMRDRASGLLVALDALRHPTGGWREAGDHPFQANAHMHLLEACMAWEALDGDGPWRSLADEIITLARTHFIDRDGGFLREFFAADWSPAAGEDGRLVEPGHQFEWAWLLTRWGRLRGELWAPAAARRLYAVGREGVDARRGVAVDALETDLSIRSDMARLWPQTERLKAALILAEQAEAAERDALIADAAEALRGLDRYLKASGLWADKMRPDGRFVAEPAPASSLYHIVVAWRQALETAQTLGLSEAQT